MGILINTGFDVGSSNPIDSRTVKNTTDERDALVTDGLVYENLKVYCKDTQTEYRWTGTEWEEVGTGGSSGGDLTDYQKKTDNTLDTTDKTITGAINEINGNLLDTVGFSADYKNIILNRKNGLNPYTIPISAIINNTSLSELKDIDSTDIGNGKTLVYDGATNKHKYVDSSITDEFVKMDSTTDAKYLSDLIDKSTVVNDNGVLKVKKLDGQEVTITEINYLKGLTMNVMDLVNAFANGGVKVLNTPLNTASELDTMDRTSFTDGISYIVYVLADETHSNAKTTYLCTKTSTTFFGNADSQRNFTTNPIDLANEVTGKLGTSNIDVDSLWTLLTINDTYKTLTTNNEIFGTHGAKAMYDELITAIGEKANTSDIPTEIAKLETELSSNLGDLTKLKTKEKSNVVGAVNEVANCVGVIITNPDDTDLNNYKTNGGYTFGNWKNYANAPFNNTNGTMLVEDTGAYKTQIAIHRSTGVVKTRLFADGAWTPWVELATMDRVPDISNSDLTNMNTKLIQLENTVNQVVKKDVPKTTLTPEFPGEVKVASGGVAITYIVRNGWCNVNFAFNLASATTFSWTNIATGLPKPANNVNTLLTDETGKLNRTIAIKITSTGTVNSRIPVAFTAVDWWTGNISYPVAE